MSIFNTFEQRAAILDAFEGTVKLEMNVAGWLQDAFRDLYLSENSRIQTNSELVAFWSEAAQRGSKVLAKVRQQFNREGRNIHEELGINYNEEAGKYAGLKVDKELTSVVIAPVRVSSKEGAIDSELVKLAKAFEAEPSAANLAALNAAIAGIEITSGMVAAA
jgi:alkyl hydroperoxide reductase subunit AhpF